MFPLEHKIVAEYCSTHSLQECTNFVAKELARGIFIPLIIFGAFGIGCLIYYLLKKLRRKND